MIILILNKFRCKLKQKISTKLYIKYLYTLFNTVGHIRSAQTYSGIQNTVGHMEYLYEINETLIISLYDIDARQLRGRCQG